jgi:exodeoxyribonuclease-3
MRQERVIDWVRAHRPDVLCMQEIKVVDGDFPGLELIAEGYQLAVHGQKTYNGVAIASRAPMTDVVRGLDDQARLLAATIDGIRVITAYFPNGGVVRSDKYEYKLRWMAELRAWLERHERADQPLALVGDFNVAPEDRDVWDPKVWIGKTLFTEPEKTALAALRDWGLSDVFRKHHDEGGQFTYYDYRTAALYMNQGLRIDHVYATAPLAARSTACDIDREARKGKNASDHAPVIAVFD